MHSLATLEPRSGAGRNLLGILVQVQARVAGAIRGATVGELCTIDSAALLNRYPVASARLVHDEEKGLEPQHACHYIDFPPQKPVESRTVWPRDSRLSVQGRRDPAGRAAGARFSRPSDLSGMAFSPLAEVRRLIKAVGYSWAGYKGAFRTEPAFRMEVICTPLLILLALWLGHNGLERALMISSILLVLFAEVLNTAIECVVDRVGSDWTPLSGKAKDLGSAAVLLALVNAATVWFLILFTTR